MNAQSVDPNDIPGMILIPQWNAGDENTIVVMVHAVGLTFKQWRDSQPMFADHYLSQPEPNGAYYILAPKACPAEDEAMAIFMPFTSPLQAVLDMLEKDCLCNEVLIVPCLGVKLVEVSPGIFQPDEEEFRLLYEDENEAELLKTVAMADPE